MRSARERHWKCAAPGCEVVFTSTLNKDDRYYCPTHRKERNELMVRIQYYFHLADGKFYRRRRAAQLKTLIHKQNKLEARILRALQMVRGKTEVMLDELDYLEKLGIRV